MIRTEESIFEQAIQFENAHECATFLDQACASQPALRQKIESLLKAFSKGAFLESPAFAVNETLDMPEIQERPGSQIGRYKLLEQIGEGGMGVVYMAEQTEPVRRRVALKVVKPGMDTRQVIARFEAERQALAMMDHLNIAKVHDGGTTKSGRPFFVMELVRGIPITEYCDQVKLAPRMRLELFVTVCQAVAHAHQKGIIHRDLKPSNILVTLHDGVPVPKVIDFGIAKAISAKLTEKTLFTGFGQILGTPLYMSPEQAEISGLDVDTRSDVYSLGVLLYELLTGQTPFDKDKLSKAGFDEMRRIIREDEPLRPSQRVSTVNAQALSTISLQRGIDERRLGQLLQGELDWIVMKALEKDRNRRYESASAFAADVERYLKDEPVEACPPTIRYRCGKFVRRNRIALAMSVSLVVALAVGLGIASWQALLARRAERLADQHRRQAETYLQLSLDTVDRLLKGVAEEKLLNEPHMDPLRKRLLADALEFCATLSQEKSSDPLVRLRTAQASRRVASISNRLGDPDKGLAASQRAIDLLENIGPELAIRSDIACELASAYRQLTASQSTLLRFDEAEQTCQKGLDLCRKSLIASPADAALKEELAQTLRSLASLYSNNHKQDFTSATATHLEAIEVWADLLRTRPDDTDLRSNLAADYHNLASTLIETGNLADAEARIRDAIREQESVVTSGGNVWSREFLGNHHFLLSHILTHTNRLEQATESLERCLQVRHVLWTEHPAVPSYQVALGETEEQLAYAWHNRSDFTKAVESAERAIKHFDDLAKQYSRYRVYLANGLNMLGAIALSRGHAELAKTSLERSRAIHQELLDESPAVPAYRFNLAGVSSNLADVYLANGGFERSEPLYRSALKLIQGLIAEFPAGREYQLRYTIIGHNLGGRLSEADRNQECVEVLRDVYRVAGEMHQRWKEVPEYEATYAESAANLAWQLIAVGEKVEARQLLELAEPILKRHVGDLPTSPYYYAKARWGMAKTLEDSDPVAARQMLDEAAIALRGLTTTHPGIAACRWDLGELCFDIVATVSADTSGSVEDRRIATELAMKEGVGLYRQLLNEKGGELMLRDLGSIVESSACLEHESFRQLLNDARTSRDEQQIKKPEQQP